MRYILLIISVIVHDCEVHGIFANNHNNMFKAISCYMKNGSKLEFENDLINITNCVLLTI